MITITNKYNCCGCSACLNVCSHHAISMVPDELGFLYPVVDTSKCINCGLCDRVCQFHEKYKRYENYPEPLAYAFRLKDDSQLRMSQSGGAFYAIAKDVLANNGAVYGAAFDEKWKVNHCRITDEAGLATLRMSKYVQSDIQMSFPKVRKDLLEGKEVLFSGTACQIAGLKSFIPKRLHSNLICIDIICHGVPSPQVWSDYLKYLENKYGSKIKKACFRDKRFGWHGAKETFSFENGKEVVRNTSNYLFFSGYSLRESCSNCKYTNLNRVGDITIGDFWGFTNFSEIPHDEKGVSLILVNSDKGKGLIERISIDSVLIPASLKECLQPQLMHPTQLHVRHEQFVRDYHNQGFVYVAKRYGDLGLKYKIHTFLSGAKSLLRNVLLKNR